MTIEFAGFVYENIEQLIELLKSMSSREFVARGKIKLPKDIATERFQCKVDYHTSVENMNNPFLSPYIFSFSPLSPIENLPTARTLSDLFKENGLEISNWFSMGSLSILFSMRINQCTSNCF